MNRKQKIVIVGANFGGLTAALALSKHRSVTVIDPRPEFEFLPNIHELLSGVKSAEQLRLSKRRLLRRAGHRFVQNAVTAVDPAAQVVITASGERISFDYCVLSVGGVNNTFGVPGADEHAMPFKSVHDCQAIGDSLRDAIVHQEKVSVVIVGGGLEGVESLGEILRRYRHKGGLRIAIIESGKRLLPGMPAAVGRAVLKRTRRYPVTIYTGSRVKSVTKTAVELDSGTLLASDLTIWTGGAAAPRLLADSGLAPEPGQWAPVRATLQSQEFDNLFVIGDAAAFSKTLSKQSYHATAMGECAAGNIERLIRSARLEPFRPAREISLISFGDLDTYLVIGGTALAGTALAPAKEFLYQFSMARYSPPLDVLPFFEFQERFWTGIRELAIPTIFSPRSLLRLPRLRLLR